MAEIDIGAIYPLYKGAWSSGAAYDFLDMVIKDGSSYLCIAEDGAPAGTAVTNTTYWGQVAQKGDTGATGAQGPTGAAGTAATITIGTVTTGAAGTNAVVTNVGTAAAAKLNFTIPRGATGATGPQGPSGVYTGPLKPTSSYWQKLETTTSITTLPSGGTWAYYALKKNSNQEYDAAAGVTAGGFVIGVVESGFCWRIA